MQAFMHIRVSKFLLVLTPVFFLQATACMLLKKEPFYTWYYEFAWWNYILFLESLLFHRYRGGLLFTSPFKFFLLLPASVSFWLIFESLNFRLQNWHYTNLPCPFAIRWLGYAISFATVIPAILATKELLGHLRLFPRSGSPPFQTSCRLRCFFLFLGVAMLIIPLLDPNRFFPLIWLAFIFLLEPFNSRLTDNSLLRQLEQGSPQLCYLLLTSGMICGLLWECWNFWAGSKWYYTIPHLGFLKIFEMPILGFFGFPPFALGCYAYTIALFHLTDRLSKQPSPRRYGLWMLIVLVLLLFDVTVFLGIDRFTVVSFNASAQ
jgi:hypothetical protein